MQTTMRKPNAQGGSPQSVQCPIITADAKNGAEVIVFAQSVDHHLSYYLLHVNFLIILFLILV